MIRQMKKNDQKEIERVCEIWLNESYRVHKFVADDYKKFWLDRRDAFREETLKVDGYVFEEDASIEGFMTLEKRDAGKSYIFALFVDSKYKRKGVGTALLDLAKHCSRSLYLHVYVRNFEAINWYFGRGFVIANTHEPEPQNQKQIKYKMVWPKPLAPADPG